MSSSNASRPEAATQRRGQLRRVKRNGKQPKSRQEHSAAGQDIDGQE